jgi:hypothetical protein
MASEKEMVLNLLDRYEEILQDIHIYGSDYPDSADGYNYLIGIAERIRRKALSIGLTDLSPLPAKK